MKLFPTLLRTLLILVVCLGTAVLTDRRVTAHVVAQGTPEVQVRMAAAMSGLFAGGVAAVLTAVLVFAVFRRREP